MTIKNLTALVYYSYVVFVVREDERRYNMVMLRIGVLAVLAGFLVVSFLLLTVHPGRAVELTGYLFFFVLALILKGILSDETH